MKDVFVKFVLKLSIVSDFFYAVIKLTQDALKELVEITSCKYYIEVATHLNDMS